MDENEKPERYFLVSYSCSVIMEHVNFLQMKPTVNEVIGDCCFANLGFPSRTRICECISDVTKGAEGIVIVSLFEFQSKQDYLDYRDSLEFDRALSDLLK
jgi:hypothetical protein